MSIDDTVGTSLLDDLSELRAVLAHHRFPTSQDAMLALLVARHEPARMLWRLAALSRTREYHSVDEVCDEIERSGRVGMPPPPGR